MYISAKTLSVVLCCVCVVFHFLLLWLSVLPQPWYLENMARLLILCGNNICYSVLASKAINGRLFDISQLLVFIILVSLGLEVKITVSKHTSHFCDEKRSSVLVIRSSIVSLPSRASADTLAQQVSFDKRGVCS